jgi:RNA polymerase sigma-70 factor, ECF subfamily
VDAFVAPSRDLAPLENTAAATKRDLYARLDAAMERYVDGELAAFDELYTLVSQRVFRYLLTLVGDRHTASDLMQLVFMRLHTARRAWVRGSHILPYVLAIARNAAFDDRASFAHRKIGLTKTGEVPEVETEPARMPDPSSIRDVQSAVAALPDQLREAIELTKKSELSLREAALVAGCTETAMKLRVHRAYKILRQQLAHLAAELEDLDVTAR